MKKRFLFFLTFFPLITVGQSFELVKTFIGYNSSIETVRYTPDGNNIISGDYDGNLFFWDASSFNLVKVLKAHKKEIIQISFSLDGKIMSTSSYDGTVKLWDLSKSEQLRSIDSPHGLPVIFSIVSPDNKFIYFGNKGGDLYMANLIGESSTFLLYHNNFFMTDAIFSFDKTHFIFSSGYSIKFVDFKTDKIDKEIGTCDTYVNNLVLSPNDNNVIVSWCEDGTINFWNIKENKNISSIVGGDKGYSPIAFSKDGKYLISGNSKANARIWNPTTKNLIAELKGHTDKVRSFAFSPDGKYIVTSSYDSTLKLWKISDVPISKVQIFDTISKPEIHFEKNNIPTSVANRHVTKQEDIKVKNQNIEFFVWDIEEEDGDTISLNINGTWVLENYEVTKFKKSIQVYLQANTNNYLILYAHNLGKKPPNTTAVSIYDGNSEKILTIKSDLKSCGAINFIYNAKK